MVAAAAEEGAGGEDHGGGGAQIQRRRPWRQAEGRGRRRLLVPTRAARPRRRHPGPRRLTPATELAAQLRGACAGGADGALEPLDAVTPNAFNNGYFRFALGRRYGRDGAAFAADFAKAMVRMGNLAPAPGRPWPGTR